MKDAKHLSYYFFSVTSLKTGDESETELRLLLTFIKLFYYLNHSKVDIKMSKTRVFVVGVGMTKVRNIFVIFYVLNPKLQTISRFVVKVCQYYLKLFYYHRP